MMKSLLVFFPILLAAIPCCAQRGGVGVAAVGVGGFGNVLHPGTGSPGLSFGSRSPSARGTVRSTGLFAGYPLYVGGAYVPSYYPGDYSSQTQLNPQQQYAPAPPVVINQYFAPPLPPPPVTAGFYQPNSDRPQADEDAAPPQNKYYLLAFKDHSVYSALAYWVEDKTLHYVTTQNTHNQASLDLVDLEFTKQLNRDREVPFSLEAPSK